MLGLFIVFYSFAVIWPRDWLSQEFPHARIISLGYDMPISKWIGDGLPIQDQAMIALKKLKLAKIGDKPVVFITHSFGGLLVKQILQVRALYVSPMSALNS
jgi:protein SERAC1